MKPPSPVLRSSLTTPKGPKSPTSRSRASPLSQRNFSARASSVAKPIGASARRATTFTPAAASELHVPLNASSIHASVRSPATSVPTAEVPKGTAERSTIRLQSVGTSGMNDDARLLADARFDPTDDLRTGNRGNRGRSVGHRHDEREAHTHVKDAVSLLAKVAAPDEFLQDRRHRPAGLLEDRLDVLRQRAREVFQQAAARDVRHRLNARDSLERAHGSIVRRMCGEQRIGKRSTFERSVPLVARDQRARERIAVGVQADRRQTNNRVARLDAAEPLERFDLDDAHDRSREIEMRRLIEARHFGGFAAEQRALVNATGLRATAHNVGRDRGIQLSHGEVIQKEEWRCVADEDVVDAVIDQIGADRRVPSELGRQHDLRAYSVGRGNECAAGVARHAKEPRKAADGFELVGVTPLAQHRRVTRDGLISRTNVDAGSRVAIRSSFLLYTRILPAFCHRLAVVHHRKGPPCKFVSLTTRPVTCVPERSSSPSSQIARSKPAPKRSTTNSAA